jgi:integrase
MRQRGYSPATVYARRRALARMAAVIPVPLLEASPADLAAWREGLTVTGNTAVQYAAHARAFYAWAVQAGRCQSDPAAALALPRMIRGLPRPAGEDLLLSALESAPPRVRPWLVLAGWAGLRAKEIALLRRERVLDTASPPVILVASDATKGRRERLVPMSKFVVTEMRLCMPRGMGFVFPRCDGLPGANRPWTVSHVANDYLREYGFTLHQCRHRFGTAAYRATKDLRAVQSLLGHADPATTAGYAAFDNTAAIAAVEAIPAPARMRSLGEAAG